MVEVTWFEKVDGSSQLVHLVNGSGAFRGELLPSGQDGGLGNWNCRHRSHAKLVRSLRLRGDMYVLTGQITY